MEPIFLKKYIKLTILQLANLNKKMTHITITILQYHTFCLGIMFLYFLSMKILGEKS